MEDPYQTNPSSPYFSTQPEILERFRALQQSVVYQRNLPPKVATFVGSLINDPANRENMERLHCLYLGASVKNEGIDLRVAGSLFNSPRAGRADHLISLHNVFERFEGDGGDALADDIYAQIRRASDLMNIRELDIEWLTLQNTVPTSDTHSHSFPVLGVTYSGMGPHLIPDEGLIHDKENQKHIVNPNLATRLTGPSLCVIHPREWHASPPPAYEADGNKARLRLYLFIYCRRPGDRSTYL